MEENKEIMSNISKYETVIGLEVHIQLNTQSKMYCGCSNVADDKIPNSVVCPVCFGMPGTLPVTNKNAVLKTLLFAKAIGAKLSDEWNFERKNYFYPDLPKGYQITSSTNPPAVGGEIRVVDSQTGEQFTVAIHHLHLEEDAGKLMHGKDGYSYVDLNRCGTPLIEMVTEPVITSPSEAKKLLKELQVLVRRIKISDADMEKGHMRCDANVSLRLKGEHKFGKKVEVKNLNSFRMVERALNYEISRQEEVLDRGEEIVQETRGWDDARGITLGQRNKEDSQDYRYMPDPDLPPIIRLNVSEFTDESLLKILPELPQQLRGRLQSEYGLDLIQAERCVDDLALCEMYENVISRLKTIDKVDHKLIATNLVFGDLYRVTQEKNINLAESGVAVADLVDLIEKIYGGVINHNLLKNSLGDFLLDKFNYFQFLEMITKDNNIDLERVISETLESNPKALAQYKSGDKKVYGFFVGQIMAKTQGKADPREVDEKLRLALDHLKI